MPSLYVVRITKCKPIPPKVNRTSNTSAGSTADTNTPPALNDRVLAAVKTVPSGGRYQISAGAFTALGRAVVVDQSGNLSIRFDEAKPSFCSGATYLIFLAVISQVSLEGWLHLDRSTVQALMVNNRPDGVGVWGRWNANGPGTARLFYELGLGRNLTSFEEGRAGDFLKIFWTEDIGANEFGHSVIYLGSSPGNGSEELVTFWSSNVPDGFGYKTVPKSKIRRALFSRLENLQAIGEVRNLAVCDEYLAAMLRRPSTEEELLSMVGIARPSLNQDSSDSRPSSPSDAQEKAGANS